MREQDTDSVRVIKSSKRRNTARVVCGARRRHQAGSQASRLVWCTSGDEDDERDNDEEDNEDPDESQRRQQDHLEPLAG